MEAQTICFTCPVRLECKAYSEETDSDHGVWAGEFKSPRKAKR